MAKENKRLLSKPFSWVVGDASSYLQFLSSKGWFSPYFVPRVTDALLRGVAQVCFSSNPLSGLIIIIGLFTGGITVGLATLLCSLIAIATAKFLGSADGHVSVGLISYSAVLVGTVTAALYPLFFESEYLGATQWVCMIIAAAYSVLVGIALDRLLSGMNLPVFTLPFNVSCSMLFIVLKAIENKDGITAKQDTTNNIVPDQNSITWPEVMLGTLLSAGQVYAVEGTLCSILVLLGLIVNSPILAAVSYIGGFIGTFVALLITSANQHSLIVAGVWGYNGFLSCACIMFFYEVAWKSIVFAILNSVSATVMQAAILPLFAANNLPVFTFPFCISSILFMLVADSTACGLKRAKTVTYIEEHLWNLYFMKTKHGKNAECGEEGDTGLKNSRINIAESNSEIINI